MINRDDDDSGAGDGCQNLCLRSVCCVLLVSATVVLLMNNSSVSRPFIITEYMWPSSSTADLNFDSARGMKLRTKFVYPTNNKGSFHAVSSDSLLNFTAPAPHHLPRQPYPAILVSSLFLCALIGGRKFMAIYLLLFLFLIKFHAEADVLFM